jgi:hypothetical protein
MFSGILLSVLDDLFAEKFVILNQSMNDKFPAGQ